MLKEKFRFTWDQLIVILIGLFFAVNLLFLGRFPFMHSDESWLSGLTRSMLAGGPAATETFFDLFPRNPHAIKTLFHGIQLLFSFLFGYNLFAFRLVSLMFGVLTLFLTYKLASELMDDRRMAFFATAALSVCIQFIYASHFARQEIIIATVMVGAIYYLVKKRPGWKMHNDIILAIITGISIGIHPNSFLVALAVGSVYIHRIFFEKKIRVSNMVVYIIATGAMAGIFVGISFVMDPDFISNYIRYGSDLGVTSPIAGRYDGLFSYYGKLFRQSSGTYYTPNIRGELILIAASVLVLIAAGIKNRKYRVILFPLIAVNLGFVIIGRYSQPGILFIFPLGLIALFQLVQIIKPKKNSLLSLIICAGLLVNSIGMVIPWLNDDYNRYLDEIRIHVPADAKVLANLNTEYAFNADSLLDYRNLAYLDEEDMKFNEYVRSRGIEYIIYPDEMDFIYERRPVWNIVYGNLYPYYDDMKDFLDEECTLVHTFETPYAMRIVRFADDMDWKAEIYRVD